MWTINLPLRVPVTKKKLWSLNLNQFRNTHFQTLNKAKVNFEKQVGPLLRGIPKLRTCTLEYVVYAPNRQLCDTNNVCSIVDKFFSDTLVSYGIIEDDNYNIVVSSHFRFGGIDKGNPRCEVTIRSPDFPSLVPPEPLNEIPSMQIKTVTRTAVTLTPNDLEQAILAYLKSHGVPVGASGKLEGFDFNAEMVVYVTSEDASAPTNTQAATPPVTNAKERVAKAPKAEPKVAPVITHPTANETQKVDEAPIAEPEPDTAEEAPPPPPKKKALFGSLTKPVNP